MNAVLRLSHVHDQVINWLIINPHLSLRQCADTFGYTQAWLSQLIHSDIFQAKLRQRQEDVASRVAASIPEKLHAVTAVALDKLADKVAESEDPDFILDAADRALHRMGYAPASARNPGGSPAQLNAVQNQTNVFMLGADDLAQARELMRAAGQIGIVTGLAPVPPLAIEGEASVVPASAAA